MDLQFARNAILMDQLPIVFLDLLTAPLSMQAFVGLESHMVVVPVPSVVATIGRLYVLGRSLDLVLQRLLVPSRTAFISETWESSVLPVISMHAILHVFLPFWMILLQIMTHLIYLECA